MTAEDKPQSVGGGSAEPDIVERLIRMAGSRPAGDVDRERRIHDAVLAAWRESVQPRRARRRRIAGALLAAALVVLGVLLMRPGTTPSPAPPSNVTAGRLTAVTGTLERLDLARTPIRVGDAAPVGSGFETMAGALATLALIDGAEVRVNEKTIVRVAGARELQIERGAIYVDSGPNRGSLMVRTPLGVVRDVGTRFEVARIGAAWRVRVRAGVVRYEGDAPREAAAGNELILQPTGGVLERPSTTYGDDWQWVVRAAPVFQIEGRTLGEFLDWVARESGRHVEFTRDELRQSMSTTMLHGSIDGLTVEQALDVILPACGLAHQIASQRVIVSRPPRPSGGLD